MMPIYSYICEYVIKYIHYIILFLFVLILLVRLYIKIKYKFWTIQPVFHYYNLLYWIKPIGLIDKRLPNINNYCNFVNVKTTSFDERDKMEIKEFTEFIQTYYYRSRDVNYIPSEDSFTCHLTTNNHPSFISSYYNYEFTGKKLIGLITSRPLNLTINDLKINVYYVDNLCVHTSFRNKKIAPQIIQSHLFYQRHKNKMY